jgi:outer membrane protein OmpA-like peptidoglycan-associated protein
MSNTRHTLAIRTTLVAAAVASALLAACATAPTKLDGAVQARNKLTQLQANPDLASRAPVAIKEAQAAVAAAEQPESDQPLALHRVYIADRKVETAKAMAETRLAEDQRTTLSAQRESARLDARTREADAAKSQVANARAESAEARADSAEQKLAAGQARSDADAANLAANSSAQQSAELQRQIDVLQAKNTDRGLVLTLGDMLFATGRADLQASAGGNLNRLVAFLNKYPDRSAVIDGFTDNVGTEDHNQALSERRADSVKGYLIRQGIDPKRLTATGRGEAEPVESNDSSSGRQANRRVEIIINNPASASR